MKSRFGAVQPNGHRSFLAGCDFELSDVKRELNGAFKLSGRYLRVSSRHAEKHTGAIHSIGAMRRNDEPVLSQCF